MGDRYLTDLADVARRVCVVLEVDGWQTRGRSSGGYEVGRPDHVMVHHTASGPATDGWADVNYCTFGADAAPLANLYLARTGEVWVMAAGATNTNGSGVDPCPVGAHDAMNTHAVGIEAANDGVGEVWPDVQLDAYERLVAAVCDAYGIAVDQVHAHFEYAPTRKIDPAGPTRYATGGASWHMPAFRVAVDARLNPLPPAKDDEMTAFIISTTGPTQYALVYGDGRLTGLAGDDLPGYVARFGEPIPTDRVVFDDMAGKG